MDYQQSIKNINHLKNFIRPWADCHIFFFFYSDTEFEMQIYDLSCTDEQQAKIDESLRSKFPYAYAYNKNTGKEFLHYSDKNIDIEYDFFLEKFEHAFCYDPGNKQILQKQLLQLVKILKNT